jgi:hypothetical protein
MLCYDRLLDFYQYNYIVTLVLRHFFFNDNFELHSILLECSAMHVSHTSENLAAELYRIGELKKKNLTRGIRQCI